MIRKGTYNIRCKDGLKKVDGYIYTTSVQGDPMSFGVTQYDDGWYVITELSSGMRMPFETNINLLKAIIPLRILLHNKGDAIKISAKKAVIKYGKANDVRNTDDDKHN